MDNFKIIYKILSYFEEAMDYEMISLDEISHESLRITEQRWIAILEMLYFEGYIAGISVTRSINGSPLLSISRPRITLKGLEYLNDNSMMKQAYRLLKGIKEVTPGL